MRKPNIVFIMADQLSAAFLGSYGSGVNSTPTLDRLAERGAKFERCYAHSPICAPNRATILTGRSVAIHGITTNNLMLNTDNPTYAHVLNRSGYRTGGFGKFHQTPMQMPLPDDISYLGFDESILTEDTKLGRWLDWVGMEYPAYYETALAVSWQMPYIREYGEERKNLLPMHQEVRKRILQPIQEKSECQFMYRSPLPAELHQTTYITNLGMDFMKRHMDKYPEQPFFCHISYVDPHDPYDPPAPYDTMFAPEDMPDRIPMADEKHMCETLERSRDFLNFRMLDDKPDAVKKLRALYHGSLRFIDDQIARIVKLIDEYNQWDNTILLFTTDHGDMMGDHGLITKGVKHYDKGIRCPLIVYGSDVRQTVTDRLTSSLDFFPTFCDWAGADIRPPVEGKSFAGSCRGERDEEVWDAVTVQYSSGHDDRSVYSIITDDGWRLTVFDEDNAGEMFNLVKDPDELNNLYYDPALNAMRCKLFERFVRAYMQPCRVQQYRNLPVKDGRRCLVNEFNMTPTY